MPRESPRPAPAECADQAETAHAVANANSCSVTSSADTGMITKGSQVIEDLETWHRLAGPKRDIQWQDGRSAKEAARAWTELGPGGLPPEILQLLAGHRDLGPLDHWSAEPEAPVAFDSYGGEPANLDLLVHARDRLGPLLIAVEAKADESFGGTLAETRRAASRRRAANPRSKGLDRLEDLAAAILGVPGDALYQVSALRYQLLTATAAGIAEAQRRSVSRVVLLIHEFVTGRTSDERHAANAADLDAFVQYISRGRVRELKAGTLCGPLALPGYTDTDLAVQFYVGKAVRNLRNRGASSPVHSRAIPRRRPQDLRRIRLNYPDRCPNCPANLKVGEWAYWSPSTKDVWCIACARGEDPSHHHPTHQVPSGAPGMAEYAIPTATRMHQPPSGSPQAPLAATLHLCPTVHRSGGSEVTGPPRRAGLLVVLHSGEEQLVVGQDDSTPAPGRLARRLESVTGEEDESSIIYGWPTVVVMDLAGVPRVGPLFAARLQPEIGSEDGWQLHATVEPEFNLAITASNNFDPAVNQEISDLIGDGLPVGDAETVADIARKTAVLLGLEVLSPLDPTVLDSQVGRRPGVYNAAVSVVTDVRSEYTRTLRQELQELQVRDDWITTSAAHLVPDGPEQGQANRLTAGPLASPMLSNQSQEETLESLRVQPLTVVTGPPGTGKTQLVINAVSNAWMDGLSVLVTSTNNAAVNVAVARAIRAICSGLLVRTGNREERDQVESRIATAVEEAQAHDGDQAQARAELQRSAATHKELMEKLERLDALDRELLSAVERLDKAESGLREAARALWSGGSPPQLPISSITAERRARRLLKAWFFRGFRIRRLRKMLGCIETAPLDHVVAWAQAEQRVSGLRNEFATKRAEHQRLEAAVGDTSVSVPHADRKRREASLVAIRSEAAIRIRSGARQLEAFESIPAGGSRLKRAIVDSLDHLRGWACTALSTHSNFPLEPGLFDLVIVDEASQCTLASVLPLAYRAKRLAVVGDPNQLRPVVDLGDRLLEQIAAQAGCENDDLRRRGIHHKEGSAYFAFEHAAKPNSPALLSEHYRCHPDIAGWFNQLFYDDKLTVLTDVSPMSQHDRDIAWHDVEGEAERPGTGTSWLNRPEAKQAVERLAGLMSGDTTVGVVTPFAAQARHIRQLAEEKFGSERLKESRFRCGTAHTFQGNERDAIVMSSVISPGLSESGARWIETERKLLNVAVSRARRALIVLGHPRVGELGSPTLASLRAYLHDLVAREERVALAPALFRADSESEELLLGAMQNRDLLPYHKLNVEGYALDFALREQGIQLNVEVDGDQRFDGQAGTRRQNLTRDGVLSKLGWEVLRVPAWRCHIEIELVIDEIKKARDRLVRRASHAAPADGHHLVEPPQALIAVDATESRQEHTEVLASTGTARNESEEPDSERQMQAAAALGENRGIKRAALASTVLMTALGIGWGLFSLARVDGTDAFCPSGIAWDQARLSVGQRGTFRGEVASIIYVENSTRQPTFLNVGRPFPNPSRLTVVVWGRDRGRFPQPPEVMYAAGDEICVTGEVSLFDGIAQIEVGSPSSVSVR